MQAPAPLVTLFTIPKPFQGTTAVQQRNAVVSWQQLGPEVDIVLCGDEVGVADAAAELNVRHVPHVSRNELGTPLISSAFDQVAATAATPLLCYVNTDIILLDNFLRSVKRVGLPAFLLCGRRWDIDLTEPLSFDTAEWRQQVEQRIRQRNALHDRAAMDYFVFPRTLLQTVPPFAVGRTTWDNWLIFHSRALGKPVIDATPSITIAHQDHDYSHGQGGVQGIWYGPEAQRNRRLASDMLYPFTLADATHVLTPDGLRMRRGPRTLLGAVAVWLRRRPKTRKFVRAILRARSA